MTIAFSFCAMVVCDSFVMVIMSADRVDQLRRMLLARLRESISAVDGVIINEIGKNVLCSFRSRRVFRTYC